MKEEEFLNKLIGSEGSCTLIHCAECPVFGCAQYDSDKDTLRKAKDLLNEILESRRILRENKLK